MNFDGMWLPMDEDPRFQDPQPPRGERECVLHYLERYRSTLALKCEGLDAAQLATRAVPPSTITLLGLVRHMARVEHHWFRRVIDGESDQPQLFSDEAAGFDFGEVDYELVRSVHELRQGEIAHAR